MSSWSFTPGPWFSDEAGGVIHGIRTEHGRNIVNWRGISSPQSKQGRANALLMIAAPAMPEALHNCLVLLRALTGPDDAIASATIKQAEDVLALARGAQVTAP